MALGVRTQPFSRDDLIRFMPNYRLVKTFEDLAQDVSTVIPGAIEDQTAAIALAQATADEALSDAAAAQLTADNALTAATDAQEDIDALAARDVPVALTDGPTINVDAALHNSFSVTLGGNRTLAAPTSLADGMLLNFAIRQDGTGSRTLTFDAVYDFGAAGTPTLSTGAGIVDRVFGYYDAASNKFLASFRKGGASSVASFSVHNNGVAQSIPNNAFTQLTFSTEVFDVGSKFATNAWTPPAGKPVLITGAVTLTGAAGALIAVAAYKNGAEYKRGVMHLPQTAGPVTCTVSVIDIPNGTDVYTLWAYQNTGVAQNTSGGANLTYFQGTTLSA